MLEWLESTPIAVWVQSSLWGYPLTLSMHAIGMAIVVGLTAVIALRLLGYPQGVPVSGLKSLTPALLFGLGLNALTGVFLFMADASRLFFNAPFQIKILMIIIGCVLVWRLDVTVLRPAALSAGAGTDFILPPSVKFTALSAIFIWWFSVVLSGRLIGYIGI